MYEVEASYNTSGVPDSPLHTSRAGEPSLGLPLGSVPRALQCICCFRVHSVGRRTEKEPDRVPLLRREELGQGGFREAIPRTQEVVGIQI